MRYAIAFGIVRPPDLPPRPMPTPATVSAHSVVMVPRLDPADVAALRTNDAKKLFLDDWEHEVDLRLDAIEIRLGIDGTPLGAPGATPPGAPGAS
jgi:hypothetical protein